MRYAIAVAFAVCGLLQLAGCRNDSAHQEPYENIGWYGDSSSDTVFVFVHGIFSNSKACWTTENGPYWPDLVREDESLGKPSVYLGGFQTSFDSGRFQVTDAAEELFTYLSAPNSGPDKTTVLSKNNIVFLAHSTGGIVVRSLLLEHYELFREKSVGLVLLASPSRGSDWADRGRMLAQVFSNRMVGNLTTDNDLLGSLDVRFADFVKKGKIPRLAGVDLFESSFIVPGAFWWSDDQIVRVDASTSYFGRPYLIGGTDHFSIVKPTNKSHQTHQRLVHFFSTEFRNLSSQGLPVASGWGVPRSASGRRLFHARLGAASGSEELNRAWKEAITRSVGGVISEAVSAAPAELTFDGAEVIPMIESTDLEQLVSAGHDLNGLAVASTFVRTGADAQRTESPFRVLTTKSYFELPAIKGELGQTGAPLDIAMQKEWGYYVILALANRCLELPNLNCDRGKLRLMLEYARNQLSQDVRDHSLAREVTALIEKVGG